ncbi:MAG: DUF1206 domain-containing protein [Croceibacterium sp.]
MVDKSEKFSWLVRLGYVARGLLYVVIGYLALSYSHRDKTQRGAMAYVDQLPGGTVLLYLTAIGLLAYALFKFCSLAFDVEHHGGMPKGVAVRIGHGAVGLIYAALAWTAFRLANGQHQAAAGGNGVEKAAVPLLHAGIGPALLGLVGLGFLAGAAAQAHNAVTARFMRRISHHAPAATVYFGRAGYAARAAVFGAIGWSLVKSAWFERSIQVHSLGDAIDSLAQNRVLYMLVAGGLLVFGLFSMLVGYYRIIPDLHKGDLKPRIG